jgi:hypothetical protein
MGKRTPKHNPERYEEAAKPEPEATLHVEREHKPESPLRVSESEEPSENEEKKRFAEKLRKDSEKDDNRG